MSNLTDRLNSEWCDELELSTVPAAWSTSAELAACSTLGAALSTVCDAPDAVLGFLVGRAQVGDVTATRLIVQAMIGKVVLMARSGRASRRPGAVDDLVVQLVLQIGGYPQARRPLAIAANLALDTLKAAQREWWAAECEVATPIQSILDRIAVRATPPAQSPSADDVIDAAHAMGLITDETRAILVAVYGPEELTGVQAAQRWNCSPAAIRSRCHAAVRHRLPAAGRTLLAS